MSLYNITVELLKSTLVNMTPEQIRDALVSLPTEPVDERLPASAVQGWEAGPGGTMTVEEIITLLQEYTGSEQIPESLIDFTVAENALNFRGVVNPYDATWQENYTGLAWDFVIATDVPAIFSTVMSPGDWIIQLYNYPSPGMSFTFNDPNLWYVLRLSRLESVATPVFVQFDPDGLGGIQSIPNNCEADAQAAFAVNSETQASGIASLAHGYKSKTERLGERAMAAGAIAEPGDMQYRETQMYLTTTGFSVNQVILPQKYMFEPFGKTYALKIWVVARAIYGFDAKTFSQNVMVTYGVSGVESSIYGVSSSMGIGLGTSMLVSVVVENGELKIYCTGLSATTINWHVYIESLEVSTVD
jgi:hypothetical protein